MKAVVAAFNQLKALVGAFSVITNLRMQLFEALVLTQSSVAALVLSVRCLLGNVRKIKYFIVYEGKRAPSRVSRLISSKSTIIL